MKKIKKIIPVRFGPRLAWHRNRAKVHAWLKGNPGKKIPIIGVTGTDGKTTTVLMIAEILREAGKKVAVMSTVECALGQEKFEPPSKKTSQDCKVVSGFLKEAVLAKCDCVVLEVSSVALDQGRFGGVNFAACGVTNVTPEELSYHGTFEKYADAKKLLFSKNQGWHVLPGDEFFKEWAELKCKKRVTWGVSQMRNLPNSEVLLAQKVKMKERGSEWEIRGLKFELKIPGEFNVENAMCAIGLSLSQGVSLEKCAVALKKFKGVKGRMEEVKNNLGLRIVVDFALTPNAFERVLRNLKEGLKGKLIVIFGCAGGGRDKEKRPKMGRIASEFADLTVITNDENYDEKVGEIMKQIKKGVKKGAKCEMEADRRKAINLALKKAKKGDTILITGMGSEMSRNVDGEEVPWDEKKVVKEELLKISKK